MCWTKRGIYNRVKQWIMGGSIQMNYNVAIIEDDEREAADLEQMLVKFSSGHGTSFKIVKCNNPLLFLNNPIHYDIIFLDIEMPNMSGMELAAKIRKLDEIVEIIFVTHMAQYAIEGYAVDALDFIVKPVVYPHFEQVMNHLMRVLGYKTKNEVVLPIDGGYVRLNVRDIRYIETINHKLIYHAGDKTVEVWGTLKTLEDEYKKYGFASCNRCYLVNMWYMTGVKGFTVEVDGEQLQISHPKRKSFMREMSAYFGAGGCNKI